MVSFFPSSRRGKQTSSDDRNSTSDHEVATAHSHSHAGDLSPKDRDIESTRGGSDAPIGEAERVEREHEATQQVGVSRIEAMNKVFGRRSLPLIALVVTLGALCCAITLQGSTVNAYQTIVVSLYGNHAGLLAVITIATSVINAVSKPFISKICDISSRHMAYIVTLLFFLVGYIVIAAGNTAQGYAVGSVISEVGEAGLDLVSNILVADMTNLQWRGFATALVDSPYIVFAWVGANVAGDILGGLNLADRQSSGTWRWGYGMFCILMPVFTIPLIIVLWIAGRKAAKQGQLSLNASSYAGRVAAGKEAEVKSYTALVKDFVIQADLGGLLLLAFAWCLLLLPFGLRTSATGGFTNPSLIAMFVVGGVLLIAFGFYELYVAPIPLMPKRLLRNKVFWLGVVIDVFYFASGNLRALYFGSYSLIVKDWTITEWGYFSNVATVVLCLGGLINGLILRYTHRYKFLQIFGLSIRIIAMGLFYYARGDNASYGALIMATILNSYGGAASVVGTRVATQASVPHQDLATVIALLALYTRLGGAIGSAIAAVIWSGRMPEELLRQGLSAADARSIYARLTLVQAYPMDDPRRQAAIRAAGNVLEPIFLISLILSFVPLIAGLYMPDWRLDKRHNKAERTDTAGRYIEHSEDADAVEYRPENHAVISKDILNPTHIDRESKNGRYANKNTRNEGDVDAAEVGTSTGAGSASQAGSAPQADGVGTGTTKA